MFSKHNIISRIKDSDNYYILNLLSGNADVLEPELAERYQAGTLTPDQIAQFTEKGYIADPEKEAKLYRKKYLDFIDARDKGEIQLFFVPTYSCNFACAYCYQDQYTFSPQTVSLDVIEAFFSYIDTSFAGRDVYVTLFGGEPLLPGQKHREAVEYFVKQAERRRLGIAVVTNGYHLEEYLPVLQKAEIREIQVTLDGTENVHDKRRPLKSGEGTFRAVVRGIDRALELHLPVNLRVVVDRENIDNIPELARFASQKGWTNSRYFKTQLGRNYELHSCQAGSEKIFSRLELYDSLYKLLLEYPEVGEFHRPAYSVSRFLFDNGELPEPLFDSCPGCTTEWAFDYTGKIYSCTATVGKKGEELGTFYPESILNEEYAEAWEDRDVLSIPECEDCSLKLACGGGCAAVSKNTTGKLHAPDCRPIKELLEYGISLYFKRECIPSLESK